MIAAAGPGLMSFITVFVLAAFVGYEVVSKVPSILHTPLMSGSNAIHGIILVGTMLVLGQAHGAAQLTLGFLAVVLATSTWSAASSSPTGCSTCSRPSRTDRKAAAAGGDAPTRAGTADDRRAP